MRNRTGTLDFWITAALIAGNLMLLGPWLGLEFSDQPWNNGYIYVGIARMFRDLPWTWNPLQYGGAPFHYLYPPLFHVLVVALASLPPSIPLGRAFHLCAGIGYAATPACLYILARRLFPARLPAILAAVAWGVFPSPVYLLAAWRATAQPFAHAPWPFVSLVGYDEAGHAFALPLALLAIAEAWRNRWWAASILAAAVFLTNWPGLIGLGFMLAGLAVARFSPGRVAGVAGTAYGLAAFWMTPGYFASSTLLNRIVLRHTLFAAPWNTVTWIVLGIALVMICLSLWPRVPRNIAMPAVWTALVGLVIVTYTVAGNYLVPSPHRYMLEFNAGLILLLASLLAALPVRVQTCVAVLLVIAGTAFSWQFLTHAWRVEPKAGNPTEGVAYQAAKWLQQNGGGRVMAAGELDSTLNLWSDVPQVGGSGQDVSNFLIFAAEREVSFGCRPNADRLSQLWLKALNATLIVVPGADSPDYFHWYADTAKFAALPAIWNGAGAAIYQVPDFEPHNAVVVDRAALAQLPPLHSTDDERFLESYVNWAAGKRPAAIRWKAPDHAEIDADLAPGEAILVKVNNDPGWRASGAAIAGDPIGFQVIDPATPGRRTLTLRFGASWDQWLGGAITLITIFLLLLRRNVIWIGACALVPAVIAWAVLMLSVPATAAVSEQAFIRLQPPLINPRGIVVSPAGVVAIYGLNMGQPHDNVRVWVNDKPVAPDFHQPNLVGLHLPAEHPAATKFSVEVNGCRGNEFVVKTR